MVEYDERYGIILYEGCLGVMVFICKDDLDNLVMEAYDMNIA